MSIESTINGFYSSVKQAAKLLSDYQKSIDDKQEQIKSCINTMQTEDENRFNSENELNMLCKRQTAQYNKSIAAWQHTINRYVDGKEFVNKFEKSLLLIVFADVNAGKSSLGNFISGYSFKDTPYGRLYTNPKHFSYDYAERSENSGKEVELKEGFFEVKAVQATSSIQYFTLLDGLTWVDTPGIHSLSTEYEELAKDYVKFADLILFLTPSASPWKQDEGEEVAKLINSGKPLLITITKSDVKTIDFVNGQEINILSAKSNERRIQQEQHIKDEISKLNLNNVIGQTNYISISSHLAGKAMETQDEEMFEQSNFPKFFEQIGSVISEKAVELKMRRPKDELNSVICEIINGSGSFIGINTLSENILEAKNKIDESAKKISLMKDQILANVRGKIGNEIYTLLCSKKNSGLNNDEISSEISNIIKRNLNAEIALTIGNEINDLEVNLSNTDILLDTKFEKNTQTIEYDVYDAGYHTRDPRGIIERLQAFFFDKEFKEFSTKIIKKSKEIEIGDNFNEYAESVWNSALSSIENQIDSEIKRINQAYYGNLSDALSSMRNKIENIRIKLEALKY